VDGFLALGTSFFLSPQHRLRKRVNSSFDTGGKLAGLAALNRELVARAEAIDSARRIVLDMDSTEIPVYGEEEQSAYNGHFESTCYHPLLLFNREGDCLAAKLRPGNVHSAEGWEELLLAEIERQQRLGREVVFRADAAFAKPELYEALEERDVKYAIRLPANDNLQTLRSCWDGQRDGRAASRWFGSRVFSIRQRVGKPCGEWWRRSSSIAGNCFPAWASS
jgi:hypothetical protein